MSPSEIAGVHKYLSAMFPKSTWTQELYDGFGQRLARLDLSEEQARAVIGEYRWGATRFETATPDCARLMAMLRGAEQKPAVQHNGGASSAYDPANPPISGFEIDLVRRHRENPADPIFARIAAKHKTVAGCTEVSRERWKRAVAIADGRAATT